MKEFEVLDKRNGDWYYVHKFVTNDYGTKIGTTGIAIYCSLASYMHEVDKTCYPTQEDLMSKLGITAETLIKYVNLLVKYDLLTVKKIPKKEGGFFNQYTFINPFKIKKDILHVADPASSAQRIVHPPLHSETTLRAADLNKNNINKNNTTYVGAKLPTRELMDFFYSKWANKFGKKYVANFGMEGKIAKDLLKTETLEELKGLITKYFATEDEFIGKAGYNFSMFKHKINAIKARKETPDESRRRVERLRKEYGVQ